MSRQKKVRELRATRPVLLEAIPKLPSEPNAPPPPPKLRDRLLRPFVLAWRMLRSTGITKRWLLNTFTFTFILMVIVALALTFILREYYYNGIEQGLLQRSAVTISYFRSTLDSGVNSGNSTEYLNAAQAFVEGFEGRDKMELQFLNASGEIIVSSTGFSMMDETLEDYYIAMRSANGAGVWTGNNSNGEKVIGVTRLISRATGSSAGAVRFVVSLTAIDQLLATLMVGMVGVVVVLIFMLLLSGNYFINSIVTPVTQITDSANKIALGDFDIRLQTRYDDEIGSLAGAINSMAGALAESEKLKNDFISTVSHELRTPLTAIQGWGETLRDCGTDDREMIEKGMNIIIRESQRLNGLVEDLLDFSRIQGGRMTMEFTRLDVVTEISYVVNMFSERCAQESKQLIYDEPPSLGEVYGDRDRLHQVLVNLIDNAIKYSDAGDTITVLAEADGSGERICIRVRDTGCGISAADLKRVSRRFYKANNTRRGFGIGLAVAEEITGLHQGKLSIDSTEGVGTQVTITLPTADHFDCAAAGLPKDTPQQ